MTTESSPDRMVVLAHAKLNAALRVLAREESGFHSVETILLRLELADRIELETTVEPGIQLEVTGDASVPADHTTFVGERPRCCTDTSSARAVRGSVLRRGYPREPDWAVAVRMPLLFSGASTNCGDSRWTVPLFCTWLASSAATFRSACVMLRWSWPGSGVGACFHSMPHRPVPS